MTPDALHKDIARLESLMAEKLRVRGKTFARQVRRAGRQLPRGRRADAQIVLNAQMIAQNPKMVGKVDIGAAQAAAARIADYLGTLDPKEAARTRLLNFLAFIALNLIGLAALTIWILVSRGVV